MWAVAHTSELWNKEIKKFESIVDSKVEKSEENEENEERARHTSFMQEVI